MSDWWLESFLPLDLKLSRCLPILTTTHHRTASCVPSFLYMLASACTILPVDLRDNPWRSSSSLSTPNQSQVKPSSLPSFRSLTHQLQREDIQYRIRHDGVLRLYLPRLAVATIHRGHPLVVRHGGKLAGLSQQSRATGRALPWSCHGRRFPGVHDPEKYPGPSS